MTEGEADVKGTFTERLDEWAGLDREVITLSLSLMAFSLTMQMTERFVPEYLATLGAGSVAVGFYGSFKEILNAAYPYPGGAIADRFGSRTALISFGLITILGFGLWGVAPLLGNLRVGGVVLPNWLLIFVGAFFALAWKELGLGATFALVKDAVPPDHLARGFASTEVFRRIGYLIGPLVASGILAWYTDFIAGFQLLLIFATVIAIVATIGQVKGYRVVEEYEGLPEANDEEAGNSREWFEGILEDFKQLPGELKPLLAGDALVRFANGMVYVFFVLVITRYHEVGLELPGFTLEPASFFGFLLGVEMTVALISMIPAAGLADRYGQKPVVALGFAVYATFPVLLIYAPATPWMMIVLFAFSGLRFAGMPAHKALIVGPARSGRGGRTTGVYYLLRGLLRMPAPAIGGFLYHYSPELSFSIASTIGLLGVGIFLYYGQRFDPERYYGKQEN
jgi:MFS family permease